MSLIVNEGKNLVRETSAGRFERYGIQTHFVAIGEDYIELMQKYVKPDYQEGDMITISEKIISLCQNRVVYKKDMKLSWLAKFLSKFASHSSAGIGVDSVWKMQFAIDHCGALKIIYASVVAGIGKLFGKRGLFYEIAGDEVRGLDGFYDKSFNVYGEFGIRLPENCGQVCDEIYTKTGIRAAIVDCNDFTCDILGVCQDSPYTAEQIAEIIKDNPAGQSAQLTPIVLIRKIQD